MDKNLDVGKESTNDNFIFLDMEFDCTYQNKEILSIGAVKTDKSFNIVDTFYTLIKPKWAKQINPYIEELTKITYEMTMIDGIEYEKAIDNFYNWCYLDANKIYVWGNDDKRILQETIKKLELDSKYLEIPRRIKNLQYSVSENITGINGKILSLGALKYLLNLDEIVTHNALNDAKDLMNAYKVYTSIKSNKKAFIEKHKLEEVLNDSNKKSEIVKQFNNLLEYIEEIFGKNFSLPMYNNDLINILNEEFSHFFVEDIPVLYSRNTFDIDEELEKYYTEILNSTNKHFNYLENQCSEIAATSEYAFNNTLNSEHKYINFSSDDIKNNNQKFYLLDEGAYISIAINKYDKNQNILSIYKINRREILRNVNLYNFFKNTIQKECKIDCTPMKFKLSELSKPKIQFLIVNDIYRSNDTKKIIDSKNDYASIDITNKGKLIWLNGSPGNPRTSLKFDTENYKEEFGAFVATINKLSDDTESVERRFTSSISLNKDFIKIIESLYRENKIYSDENLTELIKEEDINLIREIAYANVTHLNFEESFYIKLEDNKLILHKKGDKHKKNAVILTLTQNEIDYICSYMNSRFNKKNYTEFKEKAVFLKFKNPKFFNFIENVAKSNLNSDKYEVFKKGTQIIILNKDISKNKINSTSHISLYKGKNNVSSINIASSMKSIKLYINTDTYNESIELFKKALNSMILNRNTRVKLNKSIVKTINKLYKLKILVPVNKKNGYITDDTFELVAIMPKNTLRIYLKNIKNQTVHNTKIKDADTIKEFEKLFPEIKIGKIKKTMLQA